MQLVGERVRLYNVFKQDEDLVLQGPSRRSRRSSARRPTTSSTCSRSWATASDNVPGVKGIGEKGAIKLIERVRLGRRAPRAASKRSRARRARSIERDREQPPALARAGHDRHRRFPSIRGSTRSAAPEPDQRSCSIDLFRRLWSSAACVDQVGEGRQDLRERDEERDYRTVTADDRDELEEMARELRAPPGRYALGHRDDEPLPAGGGAWSGLSFAVDDGAPGTSRSTLDPPIVLPGTALRAPARASWGRSSRTIRHRAVPGRTRSTTGWSWQEHGVEVPPPQFDTMVASFCVAGSDRGHGLDDARAASTSG